MIFRCLMGLLPLAVMIQADAATALGKAPQVRVCNAILIGWNASLEDRQQIDAVPVPESFRRILNKDLCTSASLHKEGLIAWNLSFGTERTTAAALAFLENFYTDELSESDRRGLFSDWRYQLAKLYLGAAEFYESQALLEQALVHVVQLQARIFEAYVPGTSKLDISNNLIFDILPRASVLKARLSRSPVDIETAQALLDRHYVPVYREAAEFARLHGVPRVCPHAGKADQEKIREACRAIMNFDRGLREFWIYQAQLDLLKAPAPSAYDRLANANRQGSDDRSGSFFVKREPGDTGIKPRTVNSNVLESVRYARILAGRFLNAHHLVAEFARDKANSSLQVQLLDIGLLYADFYARWSDLPEYWAKRPRYPGSKARYLKLAMRELEQLERYVPAAGNPGRFRQIATRYLQYYDQLTAIPASRLTPHDKLTAEAPNALYYRTVLGSLEQIRTGALGPNRDGP